MAMDFVTAITLATKSLETVKAIREIDKQWLAAATQRR
jgi:hypothetical protein